MSIFHACYLCKTVHLISVITYQKYLKALTILSFWTQPISFASLMISAHCKDFN